MGIITLKEARRRSGLDLISDKNLPFYNPIFGLGRVRDGQKRMERRYKRHDAVRESATSFFLSKGYDVYPKGITVNGTGTCPDFAYFRRSQIIFVECLTEGWVYRWNTVKKRRVEQFAPIIFVVEKPSTVKFQKSYGRRDYFERILRLAAECKVFWCDPKPRTIKRFHAPADGLRRRRT